MDDGSFQSETLGSIDTVRIVVCGRGMGRLVYSQVVKLRIITLVKKECATWQLLNDNIPWVD